MRGTRRAWKPESSVMKKPPRKEDDSFFSGGLMWHIVIRGLLIGICTLASFTVLLTNTHSLGTARIAHFN